MKKHMIALVMLISMLLVLILYAVSLQSVWAHRRTPPEQGKYERTLRVVTDIAYEPISFIDKNGNYAGHDVELVYAIGEIMEANIELELTTWKDAVDGIQAGEYDLLLSVAYSAERTKWLEYSTPVMNEPYMVFGRDAENFTISKLSGAKIALMEGDAVRDAVITSYALEGTLYDYPNYIPCFEMLAAGECDYVIAPRTVGLGLMRQLGITDIEVCESPVYNSIYCFAAQAGNGKLMEEVNRALYQLSRDGTLDDLYDYWMMDYVGTNRAWEAVKEHCTTVVIVALLILFVFSAVMFFYENKRSRQLALQVESERKINALNLQLDTALRGISGGFSICRDDEVYSFIYVSDAVAALLGYTVEEIWQVSGGNLMGLVYPEDAGELSAERLGRLEIGEAYSLKYRMCCKDGSLKWVQDSGKVVLSEEGERQFYCFYQDVTELEESRIELSDLAYMDLLTGQGNKTAYYKVEAELEEALANESGTAFGIAIFDLNDLKRINDAVGHEVGDLYIKTAVQCIQEAFEEATVCRVGGDEFAVFIFPPHLDRMDEQVAVFEEKLAEFNRTQTGLPFDIGVAVGCARYDRERDSTVRSTYRRADALMYQNKRAKKSVQ